MMATVVNPLLDANWDRHLTAMPGASFFHTTAWLRVLTDTYRYRPCFLRTGSEPAPRAILPMMEVRSWLTGRRGVSLPFTDECDVCCHSPAEFSELWEAARELGERNGWKYCELRGGRAYLPAAKASVSYFGHRLDLAHPAPALFQMASPGVRQAVRKAERSGVTIEISSSVEAMDAFYRLFCRTRKKHGAPPQPFRFFAQIRQHILEAGKGCLVLAQKDGTYVAGAIYFHFGPTALYKFGASDEAHQQLRANNLVMWRAIEWHAERGFKSLDFGRTSESNAGLRRFKLGWGTTEHRIEYFKYDFASERYVGAEDRASGWQAPVLHALPAPLFRMVGAAAYRHLA